MIGYPQLVHQLREAETIQRVAKRFCNIRSSASSTLQNQQSSLQHKNQPVLQQQPKSVLRQQQQQEPLQSSFMDQQDTMIVTVSLDWQEETYQKIKSMNDAFFPELNEMYQRMAAKLQQHDSLPQQPKNDPLEKLKFFKLMLERLIMFLQTNKSEILPSHKEKIPSVHKQIVNILSSNRPWKHVPAMQQGQMSQTNMQTMQQQSQISQMHTNDGQMNSQMQPVNGQGSVVTTQQNALTNVQHSSLSSVSSVANSRQNMMDSLQPGSNVESGQSNALNQMHQVAMSSLQQGAVSSPLSSTDEY